MRLDELNAAILACSSEQERYKQNAEKYGNHNDKRISELYGRAADTLQKQFDRKVKAQANRH